MATFVVGGIECTVDERELALGHLVIPLSDLVAFGIGRDPAEVVFSYERRGPDSGYRGHREQGSGKPVTTKIPAHGEVGSLIALLRKRAPQAWCGEHESAAVLLGERPPTPPPRPLPWRRIGIIASIVIVISWSGFLWFTATPVTDQDRDLPPAPDAAVRPLPRQ